MKTHRNSQFSIPAKQQKLYKYLKEKGHDKSEVFQLMLFWN